MVVGEVLSLMPKSECTGVEIHMCNMHSFLVKRKYPLFQKSIKLRSPLILVLYSLVYSKPNYQPSKLKPHPVQDDSIESMTGCDYVPKFSFSYLVAAAVMGRQARRRSSPSNCNSLQWIMKSAGWSLYPCLGSGLRPSGSHDIVEDLRI